MHFLAFAFALPVPAFCARVSFLACCVSERVPVSESECPELYSLFAAEYRLIITHPTRAIVLSDPLSAPLCSSLSSMRDGPLVFCSLSLPASLRCAPRIFFLSMQFRRRERVSGARHTQYLSARISMLSVVFFSNTPR